MIKIYKKEMKAYFLNPLGYVYFTLFFLITSILFVWLNIAQGSSNFTHVLMNLRLALMIFIPTITMKLLVEERRNKTEQLLFTVPITIPQIVVGKFLAAATMLLLTLLISFIYPITLSFFTSIYFPEVISAYIGFFLLGASLIAICMFLTSFTESQVVAFLIGIGSIFGLWMFEVLTNFITNRLIREIVDAFCLIQKYGDFSSGLLNITTMFYYLTVIVMFIFLTVRQIERRRIG